MHSPDSSPPPAPSPATTTARCTVCGETETGTERHFGAFGHRFVAPPASDAPAPPPCEKCDDPMQPVVGSRGFWSCANAHCERLGRALRAASPAQEATPPRLVGENVCRHLLTLSRDRRWASCDICQADWPASDIPSSELAPPREASTAPGYEPLTDLERFDATNSARIVGKRGGTVPAEPWTALILRYEATVAALTAERDAAQKALAEAAREINCAGTVAHRIRMLKSTDAETIARLAAAAEALAAFAETAPGRLPQRVQDAVAAARADSAP